MGQGYYTIMRVTDYGPYVIKLVLPMPEEVSGEAICAAQFSVYVERMDKKGEVLKEAGKGYIPILKAYPSDAKGEREISGEYVTLELKYGPKLPLSSAIFVPNANDDTVGPLSPEIPVLDGMNTYIVSRYRVVQVAEIVTKKSNINGLFYDFSIGNYMPDAEGFLNGVSSYEPEPLAYGYYIPQRKEEGARPLIIWLHGAGEGGEDPLLAYTGNKVTNLASERIQEFFGGAYIFVPQTKTFWMNDGSGVYNRTGKSIYGKALKAAIDEFLEKNPGIDRGRIYIGGDSNGGFMTMRMVIDYPDFFAAAFPVCEALYNEAVSDTDIENIKGIPIWFTHAKNDPVVIPEETVVPIYKRLLAAGAREVHFTYWDSIVDIHEGFCDENGKPYEYIGHYAWVPMLNNDCRTDFDGQPVRVDGREVSLLEWLAYQRRC